MATSEARNSGSEKKPLFRLLTLVRETQCEVEVVKPILDELEVMRLCRSFGMMSSVNPGDFDFDILDAREFDDDFARFLQSDLLENKYQGKVRFKGLFGKQTQVLATLVDMKACSVEVSATLTALGEGVYCVKTGGESCSDSRSDDTAKVDVGLVVFSWLRDELFEAQHLRDTTTLVLRFLTVLTPDIICCTSTSDLEQLGAAMIDSETQQDESSYSVAFAIEKQVDAHDGTKCVAHQFVDLKDKLEGCLRVRLLKGNYPALALTKTVKSELYVDQFQRIFPASAHLKFAAWLKAESEQHRVVISGTINRSATLTESILREFDMWPATQLAALSEICERSSQEHFDMADRRLHEEIDRQRAVVKGLSKALFQLGTGSRAEVNANELTEQKKAIVEYEAFRKWLSTKWKVDRKRRPHLDIPTRLREVERAVFELYLNHQDADPGTVLSMCASSSKEQILDAVAKRRSTQLPRDWKNKSAATELYGENIAEPLSKLQKQWWLAIEKCLQMAIDADLKLLKSEQKRERESDASSALIIQNQFEQLRQTLQSKHGLTLKLSASMRRGRVICKGTKEVKAQESLVEQIVKIDMGQGESHDTLIGFESLGQYFLKPDEAHVAMFTVKARSAVHVCTSMGRMLIKFVSFPPRKDACKLSQGNETTIHALGKIASVCDYESQSRTLAFLVGDSVGLYKCDENFKRMQMVKIVDLTVRSTLTDLPFTDVFLLKSTLYVSDSSGYSQGIDIHADQINTAVVVNDEKDAQTCSRLMPFADKLAVGVITVKAGVDSMFEAQLRCLSLDDHRHLPVLPLDVKFLTGDLQVQCVDKWILAVDTVAEELHLFSVDVAVESKSFRLRRFDDDDEEGNSPNSVKNKCLRKKHWLYTFYHVFEKFPMTGLLDEEPQRPVAILGTCPNGNNLGAALENFHDFFSLLMSDLMALNKPMGALNLTEGLGVRHASLTGVRMESMPLSAFFMTLVTFLPIQICRAEANTLTLLRDGMDQPHDDAEGETDEDSWGTAAIAESIRFGLLSPLLSAWQGRCVVVTSMGKQSTGKSYFLNHLTGSSFAIAGNRCTDGAWMTLRIVNGVLLVVLDFEGLGSFERTDQEDVFLAVLNASLSMFTIFRMEMRVDKEVDILFTKFQKGVNLLKNDDRLFQGRLYMSVKDINLNDGSGVLSEFTTKIAKLLRANSEQNFLTDMYSGKVDINCSPPLGTHGYYSSLRRAKNLVQKVICSQTGSLNAYRSGDSFHDCIRLVLAKVSTLDWTTVDDTLQQLQTKNLLRRLPGVLRTGCLIPADCYTKSSVAKCLMQPAVSTKNEDEVLRFNTLARDHPEWLQCWPDAGCEIAVDSIEDGSVDFGPSVCDVDAAGTEDIDLVLVELFQRYLDLTSKDASEKITEEDFAHFDIFLSFLVRRRKAKVALWMKEYVGPDQFMDEWDGIEQLHLVPFEALLQRCMHQCAKCQLQCMRSSLHTFDMEHDCGMNHVCRGFCEYCVQSRFQGEEDMPRCAGKAGHEGKCKCGKRDHTCGNVCGLSHAPNCETDCALNAEHDGDHRCSVKVHICGMACSATHCGGKCCQSVEHNHSVHKCRETQCNFLCEMRGCKRSCSTVNHFHDNPSLVARFEWENGLVCPFGPRRASEGGRHMCDSSHMCNGICEEAGVCSRVVRVSSARFSGQRDTFDYESKQMIGMRNRCAIVLQPGQTDHGGGTHSCAKRSFGGRTSAHGCTVKCEACDYYCDQEVGHRGKHSTAHGNMRNMRFVNKGEAIEWKDHEYAPGENAIAEMCNLFCSTAGRGHAHYLKCAYDSVDQCVYSGARDHRRHCNSALLVPRPTVEVDEVLHAEYWETIGWEDPCGSARERASFAKCPYMCQSVEHKGDRKAPSHCDLAAWHAPVDTESYVVRNGYSYINGHRFACYHPSTDISHHIFVLDCSGSMKGRPWTALMNGVRRYMSGQVQRGSNQDIVSIVTFGDDGRVVFEGVRIGNAATRCVNFRGGGTFYAKGLKEASAIISRTNTNMYRPVMVFFTDGRPADAKQGLKLAKDIRQRYSISGLRAFVVGFGKASEFGLKVLSDQLGGSVHAAGSLEGLVDTFRSISASVGARTGLICSKNTTT